MAIAFGRDEPVRAVGGSPYDLRTRTNARASVIARQKPFYLLTRFLPGGTQNLFRCRGLSPWLILRDDFTFRSRNAGPPFGGA